MREGKGGKAEGPVGSVAGGAGCGQARLSPLWNPSRPPVRLLQP